MPEQLITKFHPTRFAFFRFYAIAVILIILWVAMQFDLLATIKAEYKIYLILLLFVGVLFIIISEVRRRIDRYFVTNYRIIERKGLFSVNEISIALDKIAEYNLKQNLIDRLIGTGTIVIESVGGDEAPEIKMKEIGNVKRIKGIIEQLMISWKR